MLDSFPVVLCIIVLLWRAARVDNIGIICASDELRISSPLPLHRFAQACAELCEFLLACVFLHVRVYREYALAVRRCLRGTGGRRMDREAAQRSERGRS